MIRIGKKYNIEEVLNFLKISIDDKKKIDIFDSDIINTDSFRYINLLKRKATICECCGLEAEYFYKEKQQISHLYHFNLYGRYDNIEKMFSVLRVGEDKSDGNSYRLICSVCLSKINKQYNTNRKNKEYTMFDSFKNILLYQGEL